MATKSFDEMMIIDTPEKARNLEIAFWKGEAIKALGLDGPSILESGVRAEEFFMNNPGWLEGFIAKAKEALGKEKLSMAEDDGKMMALCFYDDIIIIDSPEVVAFREAMEKGAAEFGGPSIDELLERGRERLLDNPDAMNRLVEAIKERTRHNGEDLDPEEKDLTGS